MSSFMTVTVPACVKCGFTSTISHINIYLLSKKEYVFDKRLSIGSHLPVRNAINDVTQNQELHVLLFQGPLSHPRTE